MSDARDVIDLQRDGAVFVARIVSDEGRIGPRFVEALDRSLDAVEAAGDAALVTTGLGRFYSNGLDIEGLGALGMKRAERFLDDLHRVWARLLALGVPTVAAINGHAFAAGLMLAVAHDFRLMRADRGFVCLPEIDMATGRPLTRAMVALLSAKLPDSVLHELVVTGRRVGGVEAAQLGIVHEPCPDADVLPRAVERARALRGKSTGTLAALKRGLFDSALRVLEAGG